MFLTEYDEEKTMQLFKEEGIQEGLKTARSTMIKNYLQNGGTAESAKTMLGATDEEISEVTAEPTK